MAVMYYEKDCDANYLKGKKIAVIGYGSQGHAHALNLRDSGFDVTIGLYEGSKSAEAAKKAGLPVMLTKDAVAACDVIMILVNDEKQAALYKNDIAPALASVTVSCAMLARRMASIASSPSVRWRRARSTFWLDAPSTTAVNF